MMLLYYQTLIYHLWFEVNPKKHTVVDVQIQNVYIWYWQKMIKSVAYRYIVNKKQNLDTKKDIWCNVLYYLILVDILRTYLICFLAMSSNLNHWSRSFDFFHFFKFKFWFLWWSVPVGETGSAPPPLKLETQVGLLELI